MPRGMVRSMVETVDRAQRAAAHAVRISSQAREAFEVEAVAVCSGVTTSQKNMFIARPENPQGAIGVHNCGGPLLRGGSRLRKSAPWVCRVCRASVVC